MEPKFIDNLPPRSLALIEACLLRSNSAAFISEVTPNTRPPVISSIASPYSGIIPNKPGAFLAKFLPSLTALLLKSNADANFLGISVSLISLAIC